MRVGIYDLKDPNGKDIAVQQVYEKILSHNGIPSICLRVEQLDFWQQVSALSLFIMRFKQHESHLQQARNILPIIEKDCGNLYRWSKGLDTSPFWARHKNYVLFQKFLPSNNCDTRVTVIGNRAFSFRRIVRDNDFRASGSGLIDYDTTKIDPRCLKIALEVSKVMGFQSRAYYFLINEEGEPEFCEISYAYVSSAVHNCPGYWDRELNWHEGHYWPEHLYLMDALNLPDLKMPEMDY